MKSIRIIGFDIGSSYVFYNHLKEKIGLNLVGVFGKNLTYSNKYEISGIEFFNLNKALSGYNKFSRHSNYVDPRIVDTDKKSFKYLTGTKKDMYMSRIKENIVALLDSMNVDVVLFSQPIENAEGFLLASLCEARGIKVAVPHHTRFLGRSFWSNSPLEYLPDVSYSFVAPDYCLKPLKLKKSNIFIRLRNFLRVRNLGMFLVRLDNIIGVHRRILYYLDKSFLYRISSDLPKKFVYLPLQYSPESSINIPAPFYIDQLRLVDEVRYSLPDDCALVVKEHPNMIGRRPRRFYKNLLRRSALTIVNPSLSSDELIKLGICTVSVTGTAVFEAFLKGRPSIAIGKTFFSDYLKNDLINLKSDKLKNVDVKEVQQALESIKLRTAPFHLAAPDFYDVLDPVNLKVAIESLKIYLDNYKSFACDTNN
jgi:hypothetical protein